MTANPVTYLLDALMQVGPAILIMLVGYYVAVRARDGLSRRLTPTHALDGGEVTIVARIAFWVILAIAALIALATLGFQLRSVLTFASIAVVILVIAFQQSALRRHGHLLRLSCRRLGDYIETMTHEGIVEEVHLFHSTLKRPDGKLVSLPHNKMLDSGVINRTRAGIVRAEVRFDIAYGQDMDSITGQVLEWMRQDPRVLPSPPPEVTVGDVTVMAVQKLARATMEWQHVTGFQFDLREAVAEIIARDRAKSAVSPVVAPPVRPT